MLVFGPDKRVANEAGFQRAALNALKPYGGQLAERARDIVVRDDKGRFSKDLIGFLQAALIVHSNGDVVSHLRSVDPGRDFAGPMNESQIAEAFGMAKSSWQRWLISKRLEYASRYRIVRVNRRGWIWPPQAIQELWGEWKRRAMVVKS